MGKTQEAHPAGLRALVACRYSLSRKKTIFREKGITELQHVDAPLKVNLSLSWGRNARLHRLLLQRSRQPDIQQVQHAYNSGNVFLIETCGLDLLSNKPDKRDPFGRSPFETIPGRRGGSATSFLTELSINFLDASGRWHWKCFNNVMLDSAFLNMACVQTSLDEGISAFTSDVHIRTASRTTHFTGCKCGPGYSRLAQSPIPRHLKMLCTSMSAWNGNALAAAAALFCLYQPHAPKIPYLPTGQRLLHEKKKTKQRQRSVITQRFRPFAYSTLYLYIPNIHLLNIAYKHILLTLRKLLS